MIRAPFDGYITSRPVAVGEYVTTSSTVATVMKLDPIRLRLQVPEVQAGHLRAGQRVTGTIDALGAQPVEGRVTAIHPALDPATRAVVVEATIRNPGGRVRAGMFATAKIARSEDERAIFVPREALVADPNTSSFRVFTVSDGLARLRVVQPGAARDTEVRILSGVQPGDQVATSGLEQLFDGASVTPAAR